MQYLLDTHGKMEDAPKLFKIPKSECAGIWIRLPRHKWPRSWSYIDDPVVLFERNLYGHPLAGLLWERQFEKVLLEQRWDKFQIGNVHSSTERKDHSCLCLWTIQNVKQQNIYPMWEVLMKDVDLGEPTSFRDHVYLGSTQRESETSKDIVENYRDMFESRISAGAKEKLLCSGRLDSNISTWSYDMEGHAKKCLDIFFELANKTTQQ